MRRRHVLASLAALTAVTVTLPGSGAAAAPAPAVRTAAGGSGTAAGAATPGSAGAPVRLPTGDLVQLRTVDGRQLVSVSPVGTSPAARSFVTLTVRGDVYVVPRAAMPRIGHGLTLGQFDVTRLAAGRAPSGDPLSAAPASPRFPQVTVTFRAVVPGGERDVFGDLLVLNVDDVRRFAGFTFFNHGVAKLSVPAGHYAATGSFVVGSSEQTATVVLAELPEFTVSGSRTVTLDARSAVPVDVRTPLRAAPVETDVVIGRTDRNGFTATYGAGIGGTGLDLSVTPTRRVTVGELHYYSYFRRATPERSYDLEFPATGAIPARQRHVVKGSQLAVVAAAYHAESPHEGTEARFAILPWESVVGRLLAPFSLPARRTEYVLADPAIRWQQQAISLLRFTRRSFLVEGQIIDRLRTYRPGPAAAQTYFAAPNHPTPSPTPGRACTACRTGNQLQLVIYPFGDNDAGHAGYPDFSVGPAGLTERTSFQLLHGSSVIAKGPFPVGRFRLPAAAGTYRAVFSTVRQGPYLSLSRRITSDWTFRSVAGAGTRQVPLLFARYLLPSDLRDRVGPGPTTVDLVIGHQSEAAAVPVRSVTLRVSFDGGTTYRPATVTGLGGGRFRARFTTPSSGRPAFQLTATDAAGGALRQTITRAFAIGSSS